MHRCDDCKIILEDSVRFCPKCGKSLKPEGSQTPVDPEVLALLDSANAHIAGGRLDQAAADASNAVKKDPNNADAAALLADIFQTRGDIAEAAVWRKIAQDLRPAVHGPHVDSAVKPARSTESLVSRLPSVPVLCAIGVGLLALIVVITVAFSGGRAPDSGATTPESTGAVRMLSPEATRARRTGSYPELAQPQTRASAPAEGPSRTAGELALRSDANQVDAVTTAGALVDDVIADPRNKTAIVTFSISGKGILTRDKVLGVAEGAARAVFAGNGDVRHIVVRCVVPSREAGGTQIGFVADADRDSIVSLADNRSLEQLRAAFTNQWWNDWIR
jgi:hypothetical protein